MQFTRRGTLGLVLGALASTRSWAEDYPNKPIKAIIPFGAGSATDVVPRIAFEQLAKLLGEPIVVENRPGAGGTIGTAAVAKSDPDGYTLLGTSSAHTIAPSLYPHLFYDVVKDFAGVGIIGSSPSVMIISPTKGIKTLQEFVAAAKAKPGAFSFATLGVGSAVYVCAEKFRLSAGYEAVHVPFKGGSEALTEVIAGRVDYYFCPIATALPFIREGTLVPLAVSSKTRSAVLPEVPTTLEAGFPDSDYSVWIGVLAPAKTPPAIIEKLHADLQRALAEPAAKERLAQLGIEPMPLGPAEFDDLIKRQVAETAAFARKAGMKTE